MASKPGETAGSGRPGAERWVPGSGGLSAIRAAVGECRGCELWADATQAVVSTGARSARVASVGEQPGDREDREGEPFVGPAGRVLDDAIAAAGIERRAAYLTNAVKHFRFERRGARRIHQKPAVGHIDACRPWLRAEFAAVRPRVVVALGATAARSVLGRPVRIAEVRGMVLDAPAGSSGVAAPVVVTTHPSALLRLRDRGTDYDAGFESLVTDLRTARDVAEQGVE